MKIKVQGRKWCGYTQRFMHKLLLHDIPLTYLEVDDRLPPEQKWAEANLYFPPAPKRFVPVVLWLERVRDDDREAHAEEKQEHSVQPQPTYRLVQPASYGTSATLAEEIVEWFDKHPAERVRLQQGCSGTALNDLPDLPVAFDQKTALEHFGRGVSFVFCPGVHGEAAVQRK